MKNTTYWLSIGLTLFFTGCATPDYTGPANPYQGKYVGTETLEGGSTVAPGDYKLTIRITADGTIRITDIDGISATGKMDGNQFRVLRSRPRQLFEGEIVGQTITGVTTENPYTGDGTFHLTLE